MRKRLLLHDLKASDFESLIGNPAEDLLVFAASPAVSPCVGCFRCWTETPGACILKGRCAQIPAMLAASDELIIISRNVYGGYSPDMKAVLDRSIGYIMPYFRIVDGEMHHTMRYENPFRLTVHLYADHIPEADRILAGQLIAANAVNLGAGSHGVRFHESIEALRRAVA